VAGVVYPLTLRFFIKNYGFNSAVLRLGGIVAGTCILSLILARPNPTRKLRKPETWMKVKAWIDPAALRSPSFVWFTISVAIMFFGFYVVFFNLEEVSFPVAYTTCFSD
jgi:MCP family monocarboxylic acid transporter-like MFS transporter 10